jgi:antitoxin (DNA-binding transcriptional repressor) of toxin-antitoxin stability system
MVKHIGYTMKTASVREIRLAFPSVLKAVRDGETVAITSRRKVVATLCPPPKKKANKQPWSDIDSRLAAQPERLVNLAEILSSDRDDIR